MYITKGAEDTEADFNWETYFRNIRQNGGCDAADSYKTIVDETRGHLREDQARFGFMFHQFMRQLVSGVAFDTRINILELGAATGFLSRWLTEKYDACATLIDRSEQAYQAFLEYNKDAMKEFRYLKEDIFEMSIDEKFDIVCSFGVIEHFVAKADILNAHIRHLSGSGYALIIIPLDSPLTRAFYEVNYELNQGYRELLSEKEFKNELRSAGLDIVNMAKSEGYVYDIVGALCKKNR